MIARLAALVVLFVLVAQAAAADGRRLPTPDELTRKVGEDHPLRFTTRPESAFLHEREFGADPTLTATPSQLVVLELEPGSGTVESAYRYTLAGGRCPSAAAACATRRTKATPRAITSAPREPRG